MFKRSVRKDKKSKPKGINIFIFIIFFSGGLVTLLTGSLFIGYLLLGLPDISQLKKYNPPVVTEVYDSQGRPLAYWYVEKRWFVPRERFPKKLIQAFLAAEDARFYEHPGIDFMGVIRAMIKNVEAGAIVQGASTITQQVTRALLLTPEKSWLRKIKEAILAWQIDAMLTKDEILTIYLNHIYLGSGAYGVEAAARTYFNKHTEDLTLSECAIIAGLPKAPSNYTPYRDKALTRKRQEYVLNRMVEEGFITEKEAEDAKDALFFFRSEQLVTPPGIEYFLLEVKKELIKRYGAKRLFTSGLKIITTIDSEWQNHAYKSIEKGIKDLCKRHGKKKDYCKSLQGALVAMDLDSGGVKALIGGRDYKSLQFNLAIQGKMQPGSVFKPIIYSAAMSKGLITPTSIITDEPISLPGAKPGHPWEPQNFDNKFMGPITVRTALSYSRNVVSVKLAQLVGLQEIIKQSRKMGIDAPLANNLTISLGSSAVPLIQMLQAYSTFPNLGEAVKPQFIQKIMDRHGRALETLEPVRMRALDPIISYQMLYLLKGVIEDGTGRAARSFGIPSGGKTGTTDDFRDTWFIGFSPEIITGVWIGRLDRKTLGYKETGGRVACPIWTSFMDMTKRSITRENFTTPPGIAFVTVDRNTGEILPSIESVDNDQVVLEAVREDSLPVISPPPRKTILPAWLKRLDDLILRLRSSSPFGESR